MRLSSSCFGSLPVVEHVSFFKAVYIDLTFPYSPSLNVSITQFCKSRKLRLRVVQNK